MAESAESRVRIGAVLAAAGSVLLIISLFLDWYEFKAPGGGRSISATAWNGLERTDVYLLVLAIAALLAVGVLLADWIKDSNAVQLTIALLGVLAFFLVIYRGTSPPAPVVFGVKLDTSLKLGWFLAALSSAAVVVGGGMAVVRRPRPEGAGDDADAEPAAPAAQAPPSDASPAPPPDA